MFVKQQLAPVALGVNTTYNISEGVTSLGGFLCTVSGAITVKNCKGTTIISAFPVTAGTYYPMPFFLDAGSSGQIVLSGGAAGTVGF